MKLKRRDILPLIAAGAFVPAAALSREVEAVAGAAPARARLGITENPFGPSPAARRAISESAGKAAFYATDLEPPLIERIAAREGVEPGQVGLANGSLEALSLLSVELAEGGRILAPQPSYATHLHYAERRGVSVQWVPLGQDHQIDLDAMLAAIDGGGVTLAYVCNPNNPTGLRLNAARLRAFCIAASKRVPVLVDEAFFELAEDPAEATMASLVREGHDVIVTRTFSKVYGLAGLRLGYALASAERIRLLRSLGPTSRNRAGLAAASASLGDESYLAGARAYLRRGRETIYRIAEANGLRYLRSHGTYVYVDTGRPATEVRDRLAALGVEVRLFEGERYKSWMRIGTATPAELEMLADALPRIGL